MLSIKSHNLCANFVCQSTVSILNLFLDTYKIQSFDQNSQYYKNINSNVHSNLSFIQLCHLSFLDIFFFLSNLPSILHYACIILFIRSDIHSSVCSHYMNERIPHVFMHLYIFYYSNVEN